MRPPFPGRCTKLRKRKERERFELELKESEDRYRTIFENTGTATVIVKEDSTIALANREFERLSGYSRSEIVGKKNLDRLCCA